MTFMTHQEIFNVVYVGLLKQGKKSLDGGSICAYRGENGTKCAVGLLIKDEFYDSEFEGAIVIGARKSDMVRKALKNSGVDTENGDTIQFLDKLQFIHDCKQVNFWKKSLEDLARGWGLTIPEIV